MGPLGGRSLSEDGGAFLERLDPAAGDGLGQARRRQSREKL
jgi:hypothetical protein